MSSEVEPVEFLDGPPPSGSGRWDRVRRERIEHFAESLRANPGQWAIYPLELTNTAARATASRISCGRIAAFGEGFQATSRGEKVYVRYGDSAN